VDRRPSGAEVVDVEPGAGACETNAVLIVADRRGSFDEHILS